MSITGESNDGVVSASGLTRQPPFTMSRASKDIAFGSLAGMVSKVFEHPFDLVKVRLQTQPTDRPPMFNGAVDCFRQTYVKEGVRGLFRGLSMPVVGATLENATLFLTYNYVQGQLRQLAGYAAPLSSSSIEQDAEHPLPMSYLAFAAACAGSAASVVLTPVELIKCKMQVQMVTREVEMLAAAAAAAASTGTTQRASVSPHGVAISGARSISSHAFRNLDGPLAILRNILRQDGFRGLWLGQTGTLLRETGGGVAWFSAFEWASRTMIETKRRKAPPGTTITKKDLSSLQLMGAGAMSGICYNVVLFPADSVKSTMQTEREWASGRASIGTTTQPYKGRGFMATLANIYKTRGFRGLYAGCGVTCLRSAPSSALIFLMYNKLEALADEWGI